MTDIVDSKTRSRMMSGIRGKNTKPEIILRKTLHSHGFRYRLHQSGLPGKPDLVFPKHDAVCFIHGCFWHRHSGCKFSTTPATRIEFWKEKFRTTVYRDRENIDKLLKQNWRVSIVWECDLRKELIEKTVDRLGIWLCCSGSRFSSDDNP